MNSLSLFRRRYWVAADMHGDHTVLHSHTTSSTETRICSFRPVGQLPSRLCVTPPFPRTRRQTLALDQTGLALRVKLTVSAVVQLDAPSRRLLPDLQDARLCSPLSCTDQTGTLSGHFLINTFLRFVTQSSSDMIGHYSIPRT